MELVTEEKNLGFPLRSMSLDCDIQHQEKASKLLLLLNKIIGDGVFTYRKVHRIDYQDEDSANLIAYIEIGVGCMHKNKQTLQMNQAVDSLACHMVLWSSHYVLVTIRCPQL